MTESAVLRTITQMRIDRSMTTAARSRIPKTIASGNYSPETKLKTLWRGKVWLNGARPVTRWRRVRSWLGWLEQDTILIITP